MKSCIYQRCEIPASVDEFPSQLRYKANAKFKECTVEKARLEERWYRAKEAYHSLRFEPRLDDEYTPYTKRNPPRTT